ncbi:MULTISPECIES: hypothetical protein [unclassified Alteromonas]|jgi:hypothetical protein|uniref:hypothetical protein n=1 Tax=unclassified Alteromonas TaxID=2614992 RepID=UPI001C103E6B|nr:hypothetical protein [Alteromonas sp. 07-89-2]
MSINRLFDVNLKTAQGWTQGEDWSECNPVQDLNEIYHRVYSNSPEDDPNFRLERGDNFYIGAHPSEIRDWTPRKAPWNFDIDEAREGAWFSFYFGLQVGESEIDTSLDNHSPWIINAPANFILLSADYHRFYSVKLKDSQNLLTLTKDNRGTEIHGAIMSNAGLINTGGYRMFDWVLRSLTWIKTTLKALIIPLGSSNISLQGFDITGSGDIGIAVKAGHSEIEIVGGKVINENNLFSENPTPFIGVHLEQGGEAIVRYVDTQGFSAEGFRFECPVDVKGLTSTYDCKGIHFSETSTARDCMVSWTRRVQGDGFAYEFEKDGELNNCGCNLDETSGLGVIVGHDGSTITINGGDYKALAPLPFVYARGNSTFILNNVTVNGELYNETVTLVEGESWRGVKADVTLDTLPVYANKTLSLPFMHIPQFDNAVSVQGAENAFSSQIDLPSGARVVPTGDGSLRYMPLDVWLHLDPGEEAIDYFRYSTESFIYMHRFKILPSPEVGAKVVQPDAFGGSGWSKSGGNYYANRTSSPLSASYNFEEGEVYQISLKLVGSEAGSVTPKIGSTVGQYSHSLEGTEVWLIRAPANATQIQVTASDYKGNVQNIFVRKLLRTETPAVPELNATVNGNTVNLEFDVMPVLRLKYIHTADVYKTGVLAQNEQDGYRASDSSKHYLFENVEVSNRRNGVNLRGAESLEVYKMNFLGGYTGTNERWQTAIVGDLHGPFVKVQQILFCTVDLMLDSNYGDYQSQFGNSDCVVVNGAYHGEDAFKYSAHIYGNDFRNSSDGVTDLKKRSEINYSRYEGGCKMLRSHSKGSVTVCNTEFVRTSGVREVFYPSHSSPYIEIWNCAVDNVRCVSKEQLMNQPKGFGTYSTFSPLRTRPKLVHVLKTYPTLNDLNRAAMTDMEFQFSSNAGADWQTLDVPNTGLPGVVGCFKRSLNFSSGTYKVRCRCLNGALVGNWSNEITITV